MAVFQAVACAQVPKGCAIERCRGIQDGTETMTPNQLKAFEAKFGKEPDSDSDPWGDWAGTLHAYEFGLQHNAAEVERLTRERDAFAVDAAQAQRSLGHALEGAKHFQGEAERLKQELADAHNSALEGAAFRFESEAGSEFFGFTIADELRSLKSKEPATPTEKGK